MGGSKYKRFTIYPRVSAWLLKVNFGYDLPLPSLKAAAAAAEPSPSPSPPLSQEKKLLTVRILVESLMEQMLRRSGGGGGQGGVVLWDLEEIRERLLAEVWEQLRTADFQITRQTFDRIQRAIFREVSSTWGGAKTVLWLMSLQDVKIEKSIACTFREQLTTPRRRGGGGLLASILDRAFRRTHRVHARRSPPPQPQPS